MDLQKVRGSRLVMIEHQLFLDVCLHFMPDLEIGVPVFPRLEAPYALPKEMDMTVITDSDNSLLRNLREISTC